MYLKKFFFCLVKVDKRIVYHLFIFWIASCGGDKNATLGCGVNCNRHCYNLNQKEPQGCILICYPNSCDCRTDKNGNKYYYDDNLKKCVLPQDCSKYHVLKIGFYWFNILNHILYMVYILTRPNARDIYVHIVRVKLRYKKNRINSYHM